MQSVMSQIFKSIVQTHCERKLYIHFLIIWNSLLQVFMGLTIKFFSCDFSIHEKINVLPLHKWVPFCDQQTYVTIYNL
jgi:hypothetical protein